MTSYNFKNSKFEPVLMMVPSTKEGYKKIEEFFGMEISEINKQILKDGFFISNGEKYYVEKMFIDMEE